MRVWHVLDQEINLRSRYYQSIGRRHDAARFPVAFCFVDRLSDVAGARLIFDAPVHALEARGRRGYPRAIARLAVLLRREQVSIVHGHFFYPTIVALMAARLAGARAVFTRHHSDHNVRLGKRWHTRVDALCARLADRVIAVSEETRRIMTEIEKIPPERIRVVYNGMDPLVEPAAESMARLRDEFSLGKRPMCLMVGRLHEEKGHRLLFEAIPAIESRIGAIDVVLVGEGAHRGILEADARARGLRDTVRFLGWRSEIPELISLASVVVLPSLAESFGFALLEAMSLGRPVVAARTGGIPEIVVDGETGLIVPPGDARALADALSRVLSEPDLANALGRAGRLRAERFSFERMIRGYEAVYAELACCP